MAVHFGTHSVCLKPLFHTGLADGRFYWEYFRDKDPGMFNKATTGSSEGNLELLMMKEMNAHMNVSACVRFLGRPPRRQSHKHQKQSATQSCHVLVRKRSAHVLLSASADVTVQQKR